MARLISTNYVVASTGWETLYATENALPRGTEAFVETVIVANPTGGSAAIDLAIVESESDTPVAGDEILATAQSVSAGGVEVIGIPDTTLPVAKIAIGRGQTLKVKSDVAGVQVRVFGTQGAEDTLVGLQLVG